jgi:hypothetical protein
MTEKKRKEERWTLAKKGAFFACRASTLKEMLQDPKWRARIDDCLSMSDIQTAVMDFCKEKGLMVVDIHGRKV